ncbi:MAG: heme-binding domain-containing protein [SAR324 cluster bacterium]|nr:heme-binding domain-containing protein [SAR324 cluster bacterium]
MNRIIIFPFLIVPFFIFAHGNETHKKEDEPKKTEIKKQAVKNSKSEQNKKEQTLKQKPKIVKPRIEDPPSNISDAKHNTNPTPNSSTIRHKTVPSRKMNVEEKRALSDIESIAKSYQETVQPIFEKKCYNCHSNTIDYPWYYKIPGIKQIINHDIEEAKSHLDLSDGFPFGGHGSPLDDLGAIAVSVLIDNMPPLRYKIAHQNSSLEVEEKLEILKWVVDSQNKLISE